ncbi:NADH-cytochrome b5 reductase [Chlorella sorokiniana]|uniref:cytochrome-b5 reductase n=1 Tax=Chlorella sorokiniana TaxID=3076 RepID=A0A2P6TTU9_CHLSO|nr:NADH-cytochrome b5 reductase [Chlorella sorokiniana]|eukprot:PRW57497.1 NADH-cytochrome b5 reductase [Chlorella sorokiniana]
MLRLLTKPAVWAGAAAAGVAAVLATQQPAHAAAAVSALSPEEWRALKLVHKEALTKGIANPTVLYRFALADKNQEVGLPVASCLLVRAPIGSEKPDGSRAFVLRPYTPVSHPTEKGHFDLAIKVYPDGKMSQHIDKLKVGDTLDFKGPLMKMKLEDIAKRKHVGLLAGGSGLTPMLQVAEEALRQKLPVKLSMIFANVSEADIIAKDRLDALAKAHPKQFSIHYIVDKASSSSWKGSTGYITQDLLKQHMPPPSDDSLLLVCGPPPMMRAISGDKLPDKSQGPLTGMLKDLGYTESQVFKF